MSSRCLSWRHDAAHAAESSHAARTNIFPDTLAGARARHPPAGHLHGPPAGALDADSDPAAPLIPHLLIVPAKLIHVCAFCHSSETNRVLGCHQSQYWCLNRQGLYDEVKQLFAHSHHGEDEPLLAKVAAALCVSAVGITVANPSDVVKVGLAVASSPAWLGAR